MEDLIIREAKDQDKPYLVAFNYNNCYETEHRELDKEILAKGADQAEKKGLHYFIAELNGKPVGCIGYVVYPDILKECLYYMVESVYVDKEHRRKGIFTRMFEKVKEKAKEDPLANSLELYVEMENTAAQKTYEKMGMSI